MFVAPAAASTDNKSNDATSICNVSKVLASPVASTNSNMWF